MAVYDNIMDKYKNAPANTRSAKVITTKTISHNDLSVIKVCNNFIKDINKLRLNSQ